MFSVSAWDLFSTWISVGLNIQQQILSAVDQEQFKYIQSVVESLLDGTYIVNGDICIRLVSCNMSNSKQYAANINPSQSYYDEGDDKYAYKFVIDGRIMNNLDHKNVV